MAGSQIQPFSPRDTAVDAFQDGTPPADWGGGQQPAASEPAGPSLGRYLSALNRFKWLIVLFAALGGAGGYVATKYIVPEYAVQATIILEQGTGIKGGGPIQAEEFLKASGWQDLLRSFAIADPVVTALGLYVSPVVASDSTRFRGFGVDRTALRPGSYSLAVSGSKYTLSLKNATPGGQTALVDEGVVGDSVGRSVGFRWMPSAASLAGRSEVGFNVQTPREASIGLIQRLEMKLDNGSAFLFLTLTGPDAKRTAATLNAWVDQFVVVATDLKKKNVSSIADILEGQREYAATSLSDAESQLESFRVRTVTEPNERQAIAPGIEMTTNPVYDNYFRDRVLAENYKRDRETIERLLATARGGGTVTREAVLSIPMVNGDPAAENLRRALAEQADREFALRRLRETYQDEYQKVKDEQAALQLLRTSIIPNAMASYLAEVRLREQTLSATIEQSGKELKAIPSRTIEEQRLKRQVELSAALYQNLNLKAAEAQLAEAATVPDVRVLDPAVAPLKPTQNTAPVIILGAFAAALGLGVVLAILLDQVDKRFRYPEQATNDLGFFILGVVPVVGTKKGKRSVDTASQVVEAFRTIRMNVRYAADPSRPLAVTITSPGPNDGKSLISSNLALSFAESGARTLLIDGDIRRGELAKTFGTTSKPGLVEYLEGTALIAEVLHPATAHPNLTLMPGGARKRRAPELLATPRLTQLISQMSAEYDVVIVDSPPLGAGFDAFALATATGNMALVLRAGVTDRKMAEAKMAVVDTLPVRVMGAVLNGIKLAGAYQYYSYYQEYAAHDEAPTGRLTDGTDSVGTLPTTRR
jgi:succinoglycan biosynthesis transport protein ExoP